jgi:20S proteasome alpha/beta subunit
VTICAAAMYLAEETPEGKKYRLLTISDRMQSAGNIEYEDHFSSKVYKLGPATAVCLGSGETNALYTLVGLAQQQLQQKYPGEVRASAISIYEVAGIYARQFSSLRRTRAEQVHLAPLGLDIASFTQSAPELAKDLAEKLQREELGVQLIIAGMDTAGPHIYGVGRRDDYGRELPYEDCHDANGFFAVGSGDWQFRSMFMSHSYNSEWGFWEALFLLYSAKKKAEAAAGVGRVTDIVLVDESSMRDLDDSVMEAVDEYYRAFETAAKKKRNSIVGKMKSDKRILGAIR